MPSDHLPPDVLAALPGLLDAAEPDRPLDYASARLRDLAPALARAAVAAEAERAALNQALDDIESGLRWTRSDCNAYRDTRHAREAEAGLQVIEDIRAALAAYREAGEVS